MAKIKEMTQNNLASSPESKRLFISLNIPLKIKKNIIKIINAYKDKRPVVRWINEDNLHITLHFLGNLDKNNELIVKEECRSMQYKYNSIKYIISEINAFPNLKNPRIVYLKNIQTNGDSAFQLQKRIGIKLNKAGINTDKRNWKPHITIGRVKIPEPITLNLNFKPIEYDIKSFELTESILMSTGPKYKTIESYELL